MVMTAGRRDRKRDELAEEIRTLTEQVAALEGRIKALTQTHDDTAERNQLKDEIETLKREKAGLVEEHERRERDITHKVGLLKTKQEQDVEHARRMAVLEVREKNLDADKKRFEEQQRFEREQLKGEIDRVHGFVQALMERLPVIDVALSGGAGTKRAGHRRDED